MTDTDKRVHALRQLLELRMILTFAPAIQRSWLQELDQLIIQQRVESKVIPQMEQRMEAIRAGLAETLPVKDNNQKPEESNRFFVSSFLLSESFAYLNRQPEESLHLATGVTVGRTCTVENVIPVELAKATIVAAEADAEALSRILAALDRMGHALTGVFHVHPGEGVATTMPSGTDRDYMKRLAGRSLVFGIWSRDGFCRLFTVPAETKVQIYGDGVTEIGRDHDSFIYKLDAPGKSLLGFNPRSTEKLVVARTVVRPSGADRRV